MPVDVLENEGSGVARGAVHDERERSFFSFDGLSEVQPEELPQLSLLQGLPVLLHQVAVSLEKVLAKSILDDVGLHERVEELVGNVQPLIARNSYLNGHVAALLSRVGYLARARLGVLDATKNS